MLPQEGPAEPGPRAPPSPLSSNACPRESSRLCCLDKDQALALRGACGATVAADGCFSPQDPYFMKNHLGSYECKLCLTLHNNEVCSRLWGGFCCCASGSPATWPGSAAPFVVPGHRSEPSRGWRGSGLLPQQTALSGTSFRGDPACSGRRPSTPSPVCVPPPPSPRCAVTPAATVTAGARRRPWARPVPGSSRSGFWDLVGVAPTGLFQ